jgi:hypothetical protein
VNWFRLKTCIKCQGDLAADQGDWLCLQCGTYYYTGLYQPPTDMNDGPPQQERGGNRQPNEKSLGVGVASSAATFETSSVRAVSATGAVVESL